MARWRPEAPRAPQSDLPTLRRALAERRERRVRRRWLLRLRRRKLVLDLLSYERELADHPSDERAAHLTREVVRVRERLLENSKRLLR